MDKVRHPARYTDVLLPVFAEMSQGCTSILDPMAGTGKIFELRNYGITADIKAIELEPEWASWHPETQVGNALCLPFDDGSFDCVIVSCTYGNRMADHHDAKDGSHRNTYTHALGRNLHPDNSGKLQWGMPIKISTGKHGVRFIEFCNRTGSLYSTSKTTYEKVTLCRLHYGIVWL